MHSTAPAALWKNFVPSGHTCTPNNSVTLIQSVLDGADNPGVHSFIWNTPATRVSYYRFRYRWFPIGDTHPCTDSPVHTDYISLRYADRKGERKTRSFSGSEVRVEEAATIAAMSDCKVDFYVIGSQGGEPVATMCRTVFTIVTISLISSWCIQSSKVKKLLLFFSHWLRYVVTAFN